jgi:flagellar assembly protein FliH
MSKVIPKEKLTAYQRWELAAFEEGTKPFTSETGQSEPPAARRSEQRVEESEELNLPTAFPTAEDLERIHQEAWQEGHDLGQAEGYKAGFESGRQSGEHYAQKLRALAESLDAEQLRQDEEVAKEILELALAIAQQMVSTAVKVKPQIVLSTIREALLSMPALSGHHRVVVHPESAEVVREWLAQEHNHLSWKVAEDATLEPGGFRIENGYSELDASMKTRWREVVACLGADAEWLNE